MNNIKHDFENFYKETINIKETLLELQNVVLRNKIPYNKGKITNLICYFFNSLIFADISMLVISICWKKKYLIPLTEENLRKNIIKKDVPFPELWKPENSKNQYWDWDDHGKDLRIKYGDHHYNIYKIVPPNPLPKIMKYNDKVKIIETFKKINIYFLHRLSIKNKYVPLNGTHHYFYSDEIYEKDKQNIDKYIQIIENQPVDLLDIANKKLSFMKNKLICDDINELIINKLDIIFGEYI